ncbi:DUF305 domain-containing protein [Scytonema sp. UIC 10036]|uniref:DUF305 domain-containing protein n=1 Tax=Scytonema sp. UIC 10036 TaxID=2304196 RepID=UPI00140F6AD4|nr:DUF305 domain-containing protein [Scytonema sp. UIC 10036]
MQRISWQNGFFTFVALTSLTGSLLASCSTTTSQTQTPSSEPTAVEAGNKQHMNHGGMEHGNHTSHSMDLGSADTNYDLRFIDGMRLHHRGAIEMAKEAEQKSKRPEIKTLARNIILAQNREENELLRWRKDWYPQASAEPVVYGGEGKSVMPMSQEQQQSMKMVENLGSADTEFDLRFMNAMIVHHEGAVDMAKDALNKSKRPEVRKLAQEIIDSQQKEIDQMNQWRKDWYKK